jgi:hypothetical protein
MREPAVDDRLVMPEEFFRLKPLLDVLDPALDLAPLPPGVA